MLTPLQTLIRGEMAVVLEARAFTRSGGAFRAVSVGCATAMISVEAYPLGGHDLEFLVNIAFTTAEGGTPGDTACTWDDQLRDPAFSPMDVNGIWRFDAGDRETADRFLTVLGMAADDLLVRMEQWPQLPARDSLSIEPVFRLPVSEGSKSKWFRTDDDGWDCLYSRLTPVIDSVCMIGSEESVATRVLFHCGRAMIEVSPQAMAAVTGARDLKDFADSANLLPTPPGDHFIVLPMAPTAMMWVQGIRGRAVLVVFRGPDQPHAFFFLGELPPEVRARADHHLMQVELILTDEPWLDHGTLSRKGQLARAGKAWYANVATIA